MDNPEQETVEQKQQRAADMMRAWLRPAPATPNGGGIPTFRKRTPTETEEQHDDA